MYFFRLAMIFFRGKIKSVRIAISHPVQWAKQHRGAALMASVEKLVAARKLIFQFEFMFS